MSNTPRPELPKAYKPSEHESRIWDKWIDAKAFHANPANVLSGAKKKPYAVLIPPPNVTDRLHLGHGLNNTLQDILVRWHRMRGDETLWMPGTDHAGIATQAVVEKRVMKDEKKRRTDFSREEFVKKIQAFKDEYEATITGQLKKMGCSCDWDRQRFTMDPMCATAVREAFFRLFKDGLIYRGKRLVNWDPALQTAVADDECYDEEVDTSFWYLRYPLVHASSQDPAIRTGGRTNVDAVPVTWSELARRGYPGANQHDPDARAWITVATTRPETYLGDTAVAVNPHDPRAKSLRGFFVELPLVGRIIPIVEDSYVVLPKHYARTEEEAADPKAEFATGFLKVTPAHDTNDYELGRRHNLDIINIMAPDGSVSDKHGWTDIGNAHIFVGKKRDEARKLVVQEFKNRGLLEEVKPYRHSVKHSDRSKAIIEPYLSDQWYVKVTDPRLAQAANAALVPEQRTSSSPTPTSPTRERGSQSEASGSPHASGSPSAPGAPSARAEGSLPLASTDHALQFYPARYAKTFEQWHDGIRDWCISRQLWWGHRIPVWALGRKAIWTDGTGRIHKYELDQFAEDVRRWCKSAQIESDTSVAVFGEWVYVCARTKHAEQVLSDLKPMPGVPGTGDLAESLLSIEQDSDVLDTWFSSALWPLSTMGWPNPDAFPETKGLLDAFNRNDLYVTDREINEPGRSTLCTAREIITLWVSRMVMFNRYFRGEDLGMGQGRGPVPFQDVFIHAVVQDGEGRKMSKSLGNGVDPLDIIASHGADAMRYTLCKMSTQTQDVRMPIQKDSTTGRNTSPKFDEGRNFCNKLWNAARFAMSQVSAPGTPTLRVGSSPSSLIDRWMLSRLASSITEIDQNLAGYHYAEYAQSIYDLLWRDFCDWYLEGVKGTIASNPEQQAVLIRTLDAILRLLHPIAPFVTEAIYENFAQIQAGHVEGLHLAPPSKGGTLCSAGWPRADASLTDKAAEETFEQMRTLVTAIRETRAQLNVQPKRRITLHAPKEAQDFIKEMGGLVESLAGIEKIEAFPATKPDGVAEVRFAGQTLLLSNLADAVDAASEKTRLERLVGDLTKSIGTLEGRLSNPGYADRAPPAMVQQTRDQLTKAKGELEAAQAALARLG